LADRNANGSTYRVALFLLNQGHFSRHVRLSTARLKKWGVSERSKWRALKALSEAGLIATENHKGRLPVVKVRFRE